MSISSISHPFNIIGKDAESQSKICTALNQVAHAEIERDSTRVKVMPIDGQPVPIAALANVAPLAIGFSSSYVGGLNTAVTDVIAAATAKAKGKGGGLFTPQRTP